MLLPQSQRLRLPFVPARVRAFVCLSAAWFTAACTSSTDTLSVLRSSTGGETARDASAPEAGEILPQTCAECSQARQGNCHELAQNCTGDPSCKRILDCTFPADSAGCALEEPGGKCVRRCVVARCKDAESTALYLALERCLYCQEPCSSSCNDYCEALDLDQPFGDCAIGEGGAGGAGGYGAVEAGAGGLGGLGGASAGPASARGGSAGASTGTAGSFIAGHAGAPGNAGLGGGD